MSDVQLITLDPGHFHAALVQKEMYPGVSKRVQVYAQLGPDLLAHLTRIASFNNRGETATDWELEVHTAPDFLARLLREKPGNVVVLSGRNNVKINYLQAAVNAGLNVLADKPWIINAGDLGKLEEVLDTADKKGLIALDIMTERFEITSILQKELVGDAETFGQIEPGTQDEPGVCMESMHYLLKLVAGTPLRRPAWFFDVHQQGEGLTDVGTHLVDLVPWMLFSEQGIDHRQDVKVLAGKRWPTVMSRDNFQKVTGESDFPAYLAKEVRDGNLDYFCNTLVSYTLRGIHVKLNILWDLEAKAGSGDTHLAIFRGSRARVEVRQEREQNFKPELYVIPNKPDDRAGVRGALQNKVAELQARFAGISLKDTDLGFQVTIPDKYRIGHEAHFAQVTNQFLTYLQRPGSLPKWEKANMLAKYGVTTKGVELSRGA